jgi:hypothetical protein
MFFSQMPMRLKKNPFSAISKKMYFLNTVKSMQRQTCKDISILDILTFVICLWYPYLFNWKFVFLLSPKISGHYLIIQGISLYIFFFLTWSSVQKQQQKHLTHTFLVTGMFYRAFILHCYTVYLQIFTGFNSIWLDWEFDCPNVILNWYFLNLWISAVDNPQYASPHIKVLWTSDWSTIYTFYLLILATFVAHFVLVIECVQFAIQFF